MNKDAKITLVGIGWFVVAVVGLLVLIGVLNTLAGGKTPLW